MDDIHTGLALGDLTGIDPDLLTEEESAALPKPAGEAGFGENLAERLDESVLLRIGQDVLDGFESDETSRADWRLREKLGMRLLGRRAPVDASGEGGNPRAAEALGISPRELEVLREIAAGHSNKEIAARLHVSPNTVKTHVARLLEKLEARRRTDALRKARELGLVP